MHYCASSSPSRWYCGWFQILLYTMKRNISVWCTMCQLDSKKISHFLHSHCSVTVLCIVHMSSYVLTISSWVVIASLLCKVSCRIMFSRHVLEEHLAFWCYSLAWCMAKIITTVMNKCWFCCCTVLNCIMMFFSQIYAPVQNEGPFFYIHLFYRVNVNMVFSDFWFALISHAWKETEPMEKHGKFIFHQLILQFPTVFLGSASLSAALDILVLNMLWCIESIKTTFKLPWCFKDI